jgi:hypothetical protein
VTERLEENARRAADLDGSQMRASDAPDRA